MIVYIKEVAMKSGTVFACIEQIFSSFHTSMFTFIFCLIWKNAWKILNILGVLNLDDPSKCDFKSPCIHPIV